MPDSDPSHNLQEHGTRVSSQGITSAATIQQPRLSDYLGQTVSILAGGNQPKDGFLKCIDCDDEAIDISQVDPTSRPADREVTRVALGGTGKARKRPVGSSDSHASRPSRGVKTAGEFQINIPQKLDKVCGAQDITTILSTLHRCSNRKRGRLTVEIYYAFLQRAPSKGSQLYRLMAYLSQCQQVKIFLRLLTSLGDCNNLSGKSSTIPQ